MRCISYGDAVNEALRQEMERDKRIFTYGIDVADHKRIFGSTKGLVERFGKRRCFSTPLSEDAMTGFGLGAAINGLRPVHVHMRADFFLLAMNQIVNMVSSYRYSTCGAVKVPLVIRVIVGRGWGQTYQHSKTLHSSFAHIPGLKVVLPTTPADAKGLLIAAMRDDDPVIVFEHRWLYYAVDEVPKRPYTVPLEGANLLRRGDDLTVVATSWMNVEALRAADILKRSHGVRIEVVDQRVAAPFDPSVAVRSVRKTGRCIVADNDWVFCGFSAEIAAQITERSFAALKAPVERIGFAFTHCPCARVLEESFYPNAFTMVRAVEKMLKLKPADISKEEFYSYEKKFKGPF